MKYDEGCSKDVPESIQKKDKPLVIKFYFIPLITYLVLFCSINLVN